MIGTRTWLALVFAAAAAFVAHACGKPWLADGPFLGDAFDIALVTALGLRLALALGED